LVAFAFTVLLGEAKKEILAELSPTDTVLDDREIGGRVFHARTDVNSGRSEVQTALCSHPDMIHLLVDSLDPDPVPQG
jgi:hypothetical protein